MKSLNDEIYQDKAITCRKCQKVIGQTRLDSQILILASGLIVFNYLCWKCECGKAASWLAPILPKDLPTIDNQIPDVGDIMHKALTLKEKAQKLGYKPKQKQTDNQHQQHFSAS
jgi:hypothetical protein